MTDYLKLIDLQTEGPRFDISPLFRDAAATRAMIKDLVAPFRELGVTHVAGIDALGFIIATYAARELEVGFIPIRKAGKLPVPTFSREFIDSSGRFKRLEIRRDVVAEGDHILIVDDWLETGAQMTSALGLFENTPAEVVGFAAICIDRNKKTEELRTKYKCYDLWRHDS